MLEDLRLMVELQELDKRIHELEKNRERLPRMIAAAGETLRATEAVSAEAEAALEAVMKEKRRVETEMSDDNERLTKLKLRSSEIKTNKEYFAHLKEIEDCQKKIAKAEETDLELMEKAEKAETELNERKAASGEEHKKFEESKVRLTAQFSEGDVELAELRKKRSELFPKLNKERADYYQATLRNYPDSAVCEAKDGNCTGCRMRIPPQSFADIRKGEAIVTCYNCRRVLYFKDGLPK